MVCGWRCGDWVELNFVETQKIVFKKKKKKLFFRTVLKNNNQTGPKFWLESVFENDF